MTDHDPHYASLGRMLVAFQSLEATLTQGLSLLLHSNVGTPSGQLAYAVVSELSFKLAVRVASLVPSIFTADRIGSSSIEGRAQLIEALSDCSRSLERGLRLANEAEQRRNQLVHSYWVVAPGIINAPGKLVRIKTKIKTRSLSMQFEQESVESIDANTDSAKEAQCLVGGAFQQYRVVADYAWGPSAP